MEIILNKTQKQNKIRKIKNLIYNQQVIVLIDYIHIFINNLIFINIYYIKNCIIIKFNLFLFKYKFEYEI